MKAHDDFGDMTRYDLVVSDDLGLLLELDCQDCGVMLKGWPISEGVVNLADANKVAAQHETEEEEAQPGLPSRPDWDAYFLFVAQAVAARADCTRRQVGAVLVDAQHRIRATGYNGSPPGGPSCLAGECPRGRAGADTGSSYDTGPGACIAVHAEQNAVMWCEPDVRYGCTMYVTDPPCDGCARMLAGAGVVRVVHPEVRS